MLVYRIVQNLISKLSLVKRLSLAISPTAHSQRGFTLIEVMIAVLILAIIAILTAQNLQTSIKYKAKIDQDLQDYAGVRNSLIVISGDINRAFHWIDINQEIKNKIANDPKPGQTPGQGQQQQQAPAPNPNSNVIPYEKLTAFVGEKDSLYFTALSHVRTIAESQESDQAKVGYFLRTAKSINNGQPTRALVRSEAIFLDGEDITKPGKETVLLEDVESLTFKYMGGENKEWVEYWKSTTLGEATSNKFPNAVEITIVTKKKEKVTKVSTVAAVHMPNNEPFGKPSAAPSPTPVR